MDVPVQFFQSTIAIELAVSGALLWEIRYFERDATAARDKHRLPDPRLQLLFALVIAATVSVLVGDRRPGEGARGNARHDRRCHLTPPDPDPRPATTGQGRIHQRASSRPCRHRRRLVVCAAFVAGVIALINID